MNKLYQDVRSMLFKLVLDAYTSDLETNYDCSETTKDDTNSN